MELLVKDVLPELEKATDVRTRIETVRAAAKHVISSPAFTGFTGTSRLEQYVRLQQLQESTQQMQLGQLGTSLQSTGQGFGSSANWWSR